ncbi:thioredoxin fold domain-containing protein [Mucilaginibacter sp. UR6-1]|uniref:thioredoxin family protein n=1 Tax=Mucilaginibacter sp. UR6-1 TaxID=1435643 RepID=UPI001E2D40D2|nr:thioredoxin fold domain-containing protein [Mucilaginibacter sp. UR6-1]MCC8408240.1 thioredoxin fold domain-containing protein [Mucilaginibacter sp. UR6-1]
MHTCSNLFLYGLFVIMMITVHGANAQTKGNMKSNSGIVFVSKGWQDTKAMAKQQHKKIFVDAYAVWCAPCKQMKEQTFKDQRVVAYFNRQFINASIDVEKGDGLVLADEFEVAAYPTLLWLDENGKLIKRFEGFVDAKRLLAMVKQVEKSN